eukprot:gene44877-59898_t
MIGNSFLRHQTQGLMMLLSDDWAHGALPGYGPQTDIYNKCKCDGQFSENLLCRPYSNYSGMGQDLIRPNDICPGNSFEIEYDERLLGDYSRT